MRKTINKCAKPGFVNRNNQLVIDESGGYISNHDSAKAWKMYCLNCKENYGANGCDIYIRKCPNCQKGAASLKRNNQS
ncbi:MAG: hypothetical protein CMH27_03520 [Micavibrio sp.]|nr:hypothetical protein [Micavibrio sp.]|tara:strand:- start:747 stop:980 length:234 start_codon:yes stop_codon:yes gene_type:complete